MGIILKINKGIANAAIFLGCAGFALCVLGLYAVPAQFYRAYLQSFVYWSGLSLGAFAVYFLHLLTGGRWGMKIRPVLLAMIQTLPVIILFFLPVLLGLKHLYPWMHPDIVEASPILRHKAAFLNAHAFQIRALLYFLVWTLFMLMITRFEKRYAQAQNTAKKEHAQFFGGFGIILLALTYTLSSIDWVMSLDPEWYSVIFGLLYGMGQILAALAFSVLFLANGSGMEDADKDTAISHHDLGNMMLAFVMLWAYLAFSEYLIIWSGNLPEEISWYLHRLRGGWQYIGIVLALMQFAIPFLLLLMIPIKRNIKMLGKICLLILVMRFIHIVWQVKPAFQEHFWPIHWLDLVIPLTMGIFWISVFSYQMKRQKTK
ncbi:MAG: hypothetical protein Q8Q33_08660 [Chlamydiota bacterium]|nr:hypothetical protein [Chlamydiota bacterium]